jgi:hypothetical protein
MVLNGEWLECFEVKIPGMMKRHTFQQTIIKELRVWQL